MSADRLPEPGWYSMRTLEGVERVRSASGLDQKEGLAEGLPTDVVVPSVILFAAVVLVDADDVGGEEVEKVIAEIRLCDLAL